MSYLKTHEENDANKLIAANDRRTDSLKNFYSTCLPSSDALRNFLLLKSKGRYQFHSGSLMEVGLLKFNKLSLPYFEHKVPAGYPSGMEDPFTRHLDLSKYLMMHPKSTYYFKVAGYSMINAGINHKDLLVVDTALKPRHRDVVIAVLNGEFKLNRLYLEGLEIKLLSANPEYPAITITKDMVFFVQGVVTTVIRTFNPLPYDNHFKDVTYPHI
ncbi:MAG: LexA family protein [Candidatus Paracaedibacter sp.]